MSFNFKGKVVFFATSNFHKFNEARLVLSRFGIASGMLKEKVLEIQSDDLAEIATASAEDAYRRVHLPLIVEDAGLFVETLKGFPGAYAAYVYKTVGNAGLLKIMEGVQNRKAIFRSIIAYCDDDAGHICFDGEAEGKIIQEERKMAEKSAFGFDPVFQPKGSKKTFAEMTIQEKNSYSHRAKAFMKFAEWYKTLR